MSDFVVRVKKVDCSHLDNLVLRCNFVTLAMQHFDYVDTIVCITVLAVRLTLLHLLLIAMCGTAVVLSSLADGQTSSVCVG